MSTLRLAAGGLLFLGTLTLPTAGGARPGQGDRAETVPVTIHEIQGGGLRSPLADSEVATFGIVTARTADGYFIQTPDDATDGLAGTSEGLFVRVDSLQMGPAQIGNYLRVEGRVVEVYPDDYPHQLTVTELTDVTGQLVLATDQPLPEPILLDAADLSADSDPGALERLEGMRVRAANLVVVGPTQSRIDPETQSVWPNGNFHAVMGYSVWGDALPLREPGLPPFDAGTPPAGKDLPVHDGNPQVLAIKGSGQRDSIHAGREFGLNDLIGDAVGVLGQERGRYALLLDAQRPFNSQTGPRGAGAGFLAPGEVKLAWMDLGDLYDASDDPTRDEPVPTPAIYQARLGKIARGLCTFMLNPEVIAVGGVENLQVLQDLAAMIETNPTTYCPEPRQYEAVLLEGNDASGLDLGFLVAGYPVDGLNPRVQVLAAETFAAADTSAHPDGGSELLFPRPPLAVALRVTDAAGRHAEFTAVNVRLHEGWDADNLWPGANGWSTGGDRIMTLRARQAARIAAWIEDRQQADPEEAIAVLGGFESDQFNDGRVDVMGIITGLPSPANQTWVAVPSPVTSPLTNLTHLAPTDSRYNVDDNGELRALDHIVVNEAMHRSFAITTAHPRMNAGFPASARAAGDSGFTFSARDPLMARLAVPAFINADTRVNVLSSGTYSPYVDNTFYISLDNNGPDTARAVELELSSTLAPTRWSLSGAWPGWNCGPVLAEASGSRVTCTNDALTSPAGHGFQMNVPADPSLDGSTATFSAELSGGHTDPDLSNNSSSETFAFDGRTDVSVELHPDGGNVDVVPGRPIAWGVDVGTSGLNPPGLVTITLDVDADASDVTVGSAYYPVTCDGGAALAPGRSRFICTVQNDVSLQLAVFGISVATDLMDGGRVIGLRAEVQTAGPDAAPDDNVATASRRVSDRTNLVLLPPFASVDFGTLDAPAWIFFGLSKDVVGVARNARVEVLLNLPPEAIESISTTASAQTPDIWNCQAPQPDGSGSRILCTPSAPVRQPEFPSYSWQFGIRLALPYRPGLAEYTVTARVTASSDSQEQVPADNTGETSFVVDQTSDLVMESLRTLVDPVREPQEALFDFRVASRGVNAPRNPRVQLAFDAEFQPGDIVVRSPFGVPLACTLAAAPAGSTAVTCPVTPGDPTSAVWVRTRPDLVGRVLTIEATALNDLLDTVPGNNVATAAARIVAQPGLCVGVCGPPNRMLPGMLLPDRINTLVYDVANLGPSTAPDSVAFIEAPLEPHRLSAAYDGQDCAPAQDIGGGRSRVQCALGDLLGDRVVRSLAVGMDTAGRTSGTVTLELRVETPLPGDDTGNDSLRVTLPIVPIVDLSVQVAAKSSRAPAPATFVVEPAESGAPHNDPSQLLLRIESAGATETAGLYVDSPGWSCYPVSSIPAEQYWQCYRYLPLSAGSRLSVQVPTHGFLQIGRTIRVTAEHVFDVNMWATDLNPANNTATAIHVVEGRWTQSTKAGTEPTPAYGTRRAVTPAALRPQVRAAARE